MAGKTTLLQITRRQLEQSSVDVVKKYTGLEDENCRDATRDLAVDPPWPLRRKAKGAS